MKEQSKKKYYRDDGQIINRADSNDYHWSWTHNIFRLFLFTIFREKVCL